MIFDILVYLYHKTHNSLDQQLNRSNVPKC